MREASFFLIILFLLIVLLVVKCHESRLINQGREEMRQEITEQTENAVEKRDAERKEKADNYNEAVHNRHLDSEKTIQENAREIFRSWEQ